MLRRGLAMNERDKRYIRWVISWMPLLFVAIWLAWIKPTCRDGYVPVFEFFSIEWICVAGYKP
jgi:hypothetical protein